VQGKKGGFRETRGSGPGRIKRKKNEEKSRLKDPNSTQLARWGGQNKGRKDPRSVSIRGAKKGQKKSHPEYPPFTQREGAENEERSSWQTEEKKRKWTGKKNT